MNRSLIAVFAATGLLVAGVLAAVPAGAATPDGHLSLSGTRIHVFNLAGQVEVVAGTGKSVSIVPTTGGRDGHRISVQNVSSGDEPGIVFTYPDRKIVYRREGMGRHSSYRVNMDVSADGRFGDGWDKKASSGINRRKVEIRSDGDGFEGWVDLKIAVPPGQRAAIHLGVGAVTVANVDGELRLDCAAGPVDAQGTKGWLDVDTGSGAVTVRDAADKVTIDTGSGAVSLINFDGRDVSIDTGSGAVKLAAVKAVDQVHVDTGSGSVEVVDVRAPRVAVDTGSGRVYVRLGANVENLDVDTGSGSITVEAPSSLDATVDMETGSGGLEVDFPLGSLRRDSDSLSGTIGGGRGRISLETGSGRIRLAKV